MRIKKIKFGNDTKVHFIIGLDLNRIEVSLFAKNSKTLTNELKLKKDFYIVADDVILDEKVDGAFIKKSEVVIVDLIYDLYQEYVALQEVETFIWDTQLEGTGYLEFKDEDYNEEEENYS